ncbi:hypothetical protein COU58_01765 [Candidatus Pacearchaeota archaeon CG10_big_fil_rev_8_21_14_0_10_32_42]|nr:MAG: hypothetical protein COU58_01765 [Candidatus Pacearchaeota archaeon CG10_big_fil_rev_8_21_14_0_10_32_42]
MTRLLFLPSCLREDYFSEAVAIAKNNGYEVYRVPGASKMKRILLNYDLNSIEKFVGIVCDDEINLAKIFANKSGILERVISFPLSKDGCVDTEFDLESFKKIL